MADSFDDIKFWLPPQFLTDDDDDAHFKNYNFTAPRIRSSPSSDFSSPVESLIGSTETESDEDDFGLTSQMAKVSLRSEPENPKEMVSSGSPQSILCALQSGCGCKQESSSNCLSRPAPPSTTWDLLHAAAGEVARMRMSEVMLGSENTSLFGPPNGITRPSPISVQMQSSDCSTGYYHQQSLSHQRLRAIRYQQMKNQEKIKLQIQREQMKARRVQYNNQVENRGRFSGGFNASGVTWPSLQQAQQSQQANGSGMRAVFLGDPAAQRQSAGTGVFLPRRVGEIPDTKKSSACSTVLIPARVAQALNMNLGEIGTHPQSYSSVNVADPRLRMRNNNFVSQQRNPRQQAQPGINSEVRLPSEWTY